MLVICVPDWMFVSTWPPIVAFNSDRPKVIIPLITPSTFTVMWSYAFNVLISIVLPFRILFIPIVITTSLESFKTNLLAIAPTNAPAEVIRVIS